MILKRFVCYSLFVFLFSPEVFANPQVRLRLFKDQKQIQLSGLDLHFSGKSYQPVKNVALAGFQKIKIQLETTEGHPQWEVFSEGESLHRYMGRKFHVRGKMMRAGLKGAPGEIYFVPTSANQFDVIASLDLETYLIGVLPSEMPGLWPVEALKAQAIASRSYAYSQLERTKSKHFDLESTISDQVYNLLNHNQASFAVRERLKKVLEETKGKILSKDNHPVTAFYHADCGGQTEHPKNVWGGQKSMASVKDAGCPLSPHAQWFAQLSKSEIAAKFAEGIVLAELPVDLTVSERTKSGRAKRVSVLYPSGKTIEVSGHEFRKRLGFSKIKSTKLNIDANLKGWVVHGKGHGHGVGLCQWGARHLARRGLSAEQILDHYYPNTQIKTL